MVSRSKVVVLPVVKINSNNSHRRHIITNHSIYSNLQESAVEAVEHTPAVLERPSLVRMLVVLQVNMRTVDVRQVP